MSLENKENKELTFLEKLDKYGLFLVIACAIVIFPITLIILTWLFWAPVN
jgi:hypothetical protein